MLLAESRDLALFHAPVQRFAKHIEGQCSRSTLAMGKYGAFCLGHRLLKGTNIGFGNSRAIDRNKTVGKTRSIGGAFFMFIARLAGLFAIRPGIDDAFVALIGKR
ncbi:hypothetical protein D3C80_1582750 [compost metagenome]